MSTDITNLSVFITGAGSGVGRASAILFASHGAKVFLTGRTESKLIETKELVLAKYPKAEVNYDTVDLSDKTALKAAVEDAAKAHGGISIVIANAGVAGMISESLEKWEEIIDTNLTSVLRLSSYVEPYLAESAKKYGQASIVFVSSVLGEVKHGLFAPYAASKHGLNGWSGSLFLHLQDKGIKVTTINPGMIDTPMASIIPTGRPSSKITLSPEQVAYTIHFAATFPDGGAPTDITLVPQYTSAILKA
jgi:NAD(P)-dependent dehydrogenase (short-subunit alcohol dehydrogenase family)